MIKKSVLYFISLIIWLVSSNNIALSEEKLPLSKVPQAQFSEFKLPGRLEGTGTRFELKDSDYLNITLDSTEPIKLVLESVPRIVTLHIEPASGLTSTQITLGGFLPLITYYKYEDSYHNLVTFTTDSAGKYTYIQDLSKPHFVFIQTHPSTVFLTDAGWSDPAIGSWDSATRTATLTADINQTIQIDANNITIDGNKHTITGSSTGLGVYLPARTGITIKNLNVSGFTYGIFLYEGSNNNLSDNTALNNISGIYLHYSAGNLLLGNAASTNVLDGIVLVGGSNNNLSDNTALNNRAGIRLTQSFNNNLSGNITSSNSHQSFGISLYASPNNNLSNNIVSDNWIGISLSVSGNSALIGNKMSGNSQNFGLAGLEDSDFNNNIDTSNTVDGKPIYYIRNASNQIYDKSTNAGTIYCISCNNVVVKDLALNKNSYGVFFWKTHNSLIENVTLNNIPTGISLNYSGNNALLYNTISDAGNYGTFLNFSNNNSLISNVVSGSGYGIYLGESSNNGLLNNTVSNNAYGIFLFINSHNNTLAANVILANKQYGLWLLLPFNNDNKTYNNNFIDNPIQAYAAGGSGNVFNRDKPMGGNYWNNWIAPDNDADGFVDNPYVFTGGNDNLPWTKRDGWLASGWFDSASPLTLFSLSEKSFSQSTLSETFLSQRAALNNVTVTGDLNGTLNFINFEIVNITTGSFAGKGFSKGEFSANIEGAHYNGGWQGIIYLVPSEKKLYLKGEISGDINGIAEGYLTEATAESGVYNRYQATWKLNRLGADKVSTTLNLEGTLSYQSSHSFASELRLYQANLEGSAYGYYSGPLNMVLTYLQLLNEGEYKGEGFSIISYNNPLGQGEGWGYNRLSALPGRVEFRGLFKDAILGKFSAVLDENKSPKALSGTIERLDLGGELQTDLKVKVWGPQRISPGQKINYIIEYRNDGLKASQETLLFIALDYSLKYISASPAAFYNDILNTIDWNLGSLPAKSSGYLNVETEVAWGLAQRASLESFADILPIEQHSDKKGIFINGIGLQVGETLDMGYFKKCEDFASSRDLEWVEAYNTGTKLGDVAEVINAVNGVATEHNGLLSSRVTGGFEYETVWGYSGGTRTLVTAIEQGKLKTKELVLISPVNIMSLELEVLHSHWNVEKIIIYQSEKDKLFWGELYQLKIPKDDPLRNQLWIEIRDRNNVMHARWLQHLINESNKNKENMASAAPSIITTARDPNIKYGPEGNVLPGQKLNYRVEYENEGEGIAFGVYFTDRLDEDLDDSTLEIGPVIDVKTGQKISQPGIYNPAARTITWFTGEVGSQEGGYAEFSANVKSDVSNGAEIINFATVYFPSVPEVTRTNGIVNKVKTTADNLAPLTTSTVSPSPNPAGWNNTNVNIALTASDNEAGSGIKEIRYKLSGALTEEKTVSANIAQILLAAEGITSLTYWAVDNAGNIEPQKTHTIKIDKTLPAIAAQVAPQPNSYGWNNTAVTVTFNATDNLSGVSSVTGPVTANSEGKEQHIGGEAIDSAGNAPPPLLL